MAPLKVLVVCGQNRLRSPTAAAIYKNNTNLKIISAGTSNASPHRISIKDIVWADLILYMEKKHIEKIRKLFPDVRLPQYQNLNIKDKYKYMDPELITILKQKINYFLVSFQ